MSGASLGQTWTHTFRQISAGTLGPPLNTDRSFARRIDYAYRSTGDGKLKHLADPSHRGCESRMAVMSAAWFVEFRQRLPWLLHVD